MFLVPFLRPVSRVARAVLRFKHHHDGSVGERIPPPSVAGKVKFPLHSYRYPVRPTESIVSAEETLRVTSAQLGENGPEPSYTSIAKGYKKYVHSAPFQCHIRENPSGGVLPGFQLAYETWGDLNADKTNAILLFTGLSASSHACSHADNRDRGWWEDFIGPGKALDTNKHFIICCNALGGCYGSTGPSSLMPGTPTQYGLSFPLITLCDMVKSEFHLLDSLGIDRLHAVVGASMGGMRSLAAAAMYPDRVARCVSISAGGQAHPSAIALRYMQRCILMADPHWNGGDYYTGPYPMVGMKHAREIATISYRSGPEWEERFGRRTAKDAKHSFQAEFLIETYLDYQGTQWCLRYDPNSFLYLSKAMDLFDLAEGSESLETGVQRVKCPTLVMGVQSDILFPVSQQRELNKFLRRGNTPVTYYELDSMFGHDTFLIDVRAVGAAVKGHVEH